jgi:hypothetical protein
MSHPTVGMATAMPMMTAKQYCGMSYAAMQQLPRAVMQVYVFGARTASIAVCTVMPPSPATNMQICVNPIPMPTHGVSMMQRAFAYLCSAEHARVRYAGHYNVSAIMLRATADDSAAALCRRATAINYAVNVQRVWRQAHRGAGRRLAERSNRRFLQFIANGAKYMNPDNDDSRIELSHLHHYDI